MNIIYKDKNNLVFYIKKYHKNYIIPEQIINAKIYENNINIDKKIIVIINNKKTNITNIKNEIFKYISNTIEKELF